MTKRIIGKLHPVRYVVQDNMLFDCIPFPTNEGAFNDFIYNVKYFTGNKYLVTGDLLDETGIDGEPLIKNVKILKKL